MSIDALNVIAQDVYGRTESIAPASAHLSICPFDIL